MEFAVYNTKKQAIKEDEKRWLWKDEEEYTYEQFAY